MSEHKELNIIQKMNAITSVMPYIEKTMRVGTGTNSYKAVKEGDVLKAVKPLEKLYGVYSAPISSKIVAQDILKVVEYDKEKLKYYMRIEMTTRFHNEDNPTEFMDIITFGDGNDSLDKAPGKATTYAFKNALCKAYKIESGDDPDQNPSDPSPEELKKKEEAEKKRKFDAQKKLADLEKKKAELEKKIKEPEMLTDERYNKYMKHTVIADINKLIKNYSTAEKKMTDTQLKKLKERVEFLKTAEDPAETKTTEEKPKDKSDDDIDYGDVI